MTSRSEQPPKESHVRWFGRSEDDPNRLLIIEDDHCRVFLDAEARAELYSVIDGSRPHPAPSTVVEDITFEGAAIVQAARSEAARKAREDVLDKVIAWKRKHGYWFTVNRTSGEKRYHFEPDRFEEFIKEIRHNAPQSEQEQPR